MRSNLPLILDRAGLNLDESGTDVRITWREWPSDSTVDPVTQSQTGTPVAKTRIAQALLHFPTPRGNSSVQQFNEIELGDCIADFGSDVSLDGKDALEFVFLDKATKQPIDNQKWVPKPISSRLAQSWGAVMQGQRIFRPVLLRKAT